jgi:hypothetical protein
MAAESPEVPAGGGPAPDGWARATVGDAILEAPPGLEAHLRLLARRAAPLLPRLERSLGARAAAPYRIVLIPRDPAGDPAIAALDATAPSWAAGFVLPRRRLGGIRVARADRYPYSDLASVLVHEAAHMLLYDAAGDGLPRWFGEGVATGLEREWGLRDALVYSSSLLVGPLPRLDELDAAFDGNDARARAAYAAAFDFMRTTVREHGAGVVAAIVREAGGRPFPGAWEAATGESLRRAEADWRRGSLVLYRVIPAVTGTGALWGAITVMAFWALARLRARRRAVLARWEAEERILEAEEARSGEASAADRDQEGGTR